MSDAVLSTLMICATIIVLYGINAWARTREQTRTDVREIVFDDDPWSKGDHSPAPMPKQLDEVFGPDMPKKPEPVNNEPLPYDPEHPPKEVIYKPRPNSPYPAPLCHCHGRPLRTGQRVLLWPVPDSEEKKIVCQREDA